MAYNTYGYTYQQPTYQQYQQQYQPVYTQQSIQPVQQQPSYQAAQTVPQFSSPSSIVWVRNQNEAMLYPVAPNNAVALWDENLPAVYLKQADASGKPTMKTYDLVERVEQPVAASSDGADNKTEYALKSDLSAVAGVVKGFDDLLGSIKADVESLKGDFYGIAGKRRSAKKSTKDEEEDDD